MSYADVCTYYRIKPRKASTSKASNVQTLICDCKPNQAGASVIEEYVDVAMHVAASKQSGGVTCDDIVQSKGNIGIRKNLGMPLSDEAFMCEGLGRLHGSWLGQAGENRKEGAENCRESGAPRGCPLHLLLDWHSQRRPLAPSPLGTHNKV